jgi:hypothetical protein
VLERRRGVNEVTGLGPAGERAHLAADDVLQVQDRSDVHRHRLRRPVEVRQLQHRALAVGRGDRPLGQPVAYALKDVRQFGRRALALGREPRSLQRALHRAGRRRDPVLLVREQVDVLGGPVDEPVRDQGVAAAEREPVPVGGPQRDRRDPPVQVVERHQARTRARRAGWWSSHPRRTPFGRYSSGQTLTRVSPSR